MTVLANEGQVNPEIYRGDTELERVNSFMETIGRVSLVKPLEMDFDFSEREPVDQATRRFHNYEREAEPTLHLDVGALEGILPKLVTDFHPLISRGGKRSNHGVFFGNLEFSDGVQLPVAVKPHGGEAEDSLQSGLRDYGNNVAINKLGFYTLQPAGIVADYNRTYSLTVLDESLSTLDSI